jgi:hypothetical protein
VNLSNGAVIAQRERSQKTSYKYIQSLGRTDDTAKPPLPTTVVAARSSRRGRYKLDAPPFMPPEDRSYTSPFLD